MKAPQAWRARPVAREGRAAGSTAPAWSRPESWSTWFAVKDPPVRTAVPLGERDW